VHPIKNFMVYSVMFMYQHMYLPFTVQFNLLKPNDIYICHNAALTSRRYILNIYSTNIHTEYFEYAA